MSADMLELREYMGFARECRELAARLSSAKYKRALEEMADSWAQLAADHKIRMRARSDTK
jgi:hypothetical protein